MANAERGSWEKAIRSLPSMGAVRKLCLAADYDGPLRVP
jgi:hypothetical protein